MDDFTQLRRRIEDLRRQIDQFRSNTQDDDTYIGRVYNAGAIPTTTPRMFATHPLDIVFSESEGATPTKTPDTTTTEYVLVLNSPAPVVNDELIAKRVGGLWIASRRNACTYTLKPIVTGCQSLGIAGVTVTASQVGQSDVVGTTLSDGSALLGVTNDSPWTVKATAPNARFVDTSISMTPVCNSTVTGGISLAAASGYACSACCNQPLATTVSGVGHVNYGYTSPLTGLPIPPPNNVYDFTYSISYDPTYGWIGSVLAPTPFSGASGGCTVGVLAPATVSVYVRLQKNSCAMIVYIKQCPPFGFSLGHVDADDTAGAGTPWVDNTDYMTFSFPTIASNACPPSVVSFLFDQFPATSFPGGTITLHE